jgi:hypothetical protein
MDNNKEFHEKVDELFKNNLKYEEMEIIRVKNVSEDKILDNINYGLLLFDSELNMFKWDDTTKGYCAVSNPNFKAVIVKKMKR